MRQVLANSHIKQGSLWKEIDMACYCVFMCKEWLREFLHRLEANIKGLPMSVYQGDGKDMEMDMVEKVGSSNHQ